LFVGLITNGTTLSEQKTEELAHSGLDFITISLDGPEETHNDIRGGINSFQKSVKTIKILREKRGKSLFPTITINLTISDFNFDRVDEMVDIALDSGADILQFQHQWFVDNPTANAYNKWTKDNLGMDSNFIGTFETGTARNIKTDMLFEKIEKAKKNNKGVFIRVYPDLNKEDTKTYYGGMNAVFTKACVNPWFGLIVKPDGDVVPCIDHVWGNLKEKPFKEIWNSPNAILFRQKVRNQKYFPGCTRCCGFFRKAVS